MNAAQIIVQQIKTLDRFALGAWGAKNFVGNDVFLQFEIKTPKYKQSHKVQIVLDRGADLYNVFIFNCNMKTMMKNNGPKLVGTVEGVFAEDLVRIIDSLIENNR